MYFKSQENYKYEEEFTLSLGFAIEYIRNCIEKGLLTDTLWWFKLIKRQLNNNLV